MDIQRYSAADLPTLFDAIQKHSIGWNNYFDRINDIRGTSNYPPYNVIHVSNEISKLEVALAGFKKSEIKVYTEYGKLLVEGTKPEDEKKLYDSEDYAHRGMAQRSFSRSWSLSDDIEVREVVFEDGLLSVTLGKIVPEHHARKDYI